MQAHRASPVSRDTREANPSPARQPGRASVPLYGGHPHSQIAPWFVIYALVVLGGCGDFEPKAADNPRSGFDDIPDTFTSDARAINAGCAQDCEQLRHTAHAECLYGRCVLFACDVGFADCDADPSNGCEVHINEDLRHCGGCGQRCPLTTNVDLRACISGECETVLCTQYHADCDRDFSNGCETFGGQNERCNASDLCQGPSDPSNTTIDSEGVQASPLAPMYIDCTDPVSFGAEPSTVWSCQQRSDETGFLCIPDRCEEGFAACQASTPTRCETLQSPTNCGFCGNVCAEGARCNTSTCQCEDGERCQARGFKYERASCDGSDCVLRCNPGWVDCDQDPTNGCEASLNSDPEHCGACNQACLRTQDHITDAACVGGSCTIDACEQGFADCDQNPQNGCEPLFVNGTCSALCGDGILDTGEDCDTPPLPTAACNLNCTQSRCGDALRNGLDGEACDDGNAQNGDGCSDSCLVEAGSRCHGPLNGLSVCGHVICGDGIIMDREQCDDINLPTASCNIDCTLSRCGDGRRNVLAGEDCDDANTTSGDICSNVCQIEFGEHACEFYYTPINERSRCVLIEETCGNGFINVFEQCDDANTTPHDGCSARCAVEFGYTCATHNAPNPPQTPASACAYTCGDGLKAAEEACDDGNAQSGDGCSALCAPESGCDQSSCP